MKKALKILTVALSIATIVLSFPACGHNHVWSDWERSADEHWRTCTVEGCNAEERDWHSAEGKCETCAYGFKVLSFGFDEGGDTAHSDFAKEANVWFPQQGEIYGFTYDFVGTDFSYLNDETLAEYDLVMFLNSRPFNYDQQDAFERYLENGGACHPGSRVYIFGFC